MNTIKIYSRNIFGVPLFAGHHKRRIDTMVEQALAEGIDIALLQEVMLSKDRREFKKSFGGGFNTYYAKTGFIHSGGGLFAIFSKNIKIEKKYIPFKSSGFLTDMSITDKIAQKGFQVFHIEHPVKMTIIHTHMTCPYESDVESDTKMRRLMKEELDLIRKTIEKENGTPIIICGDFNLETKQEIMKNFIHEAGLHNRSFHLPHTFCGNFYSPKWLFEGLLKSALRPQQSDHILTKNIPEDWKISVHIPSDHNVFLSDHVGIVVTVEF